MTNFFRNTKLFSNASMQCSIFIKLGLVTEEISVIFLDYVCNPITRPIVEPRAVTPPTI